MITFAPMALLARPSRLPRRAFPHRRVRVAAALALLSCAPVGHALNDWRRLRQSNSYSFGDYARFLIANPGWPGETTLRRRAERAMRPGEQPATVLAFFAQNKRTRQ